jgi:hypothetical protein
MLFGKLPRSLFRLWRKPWPLAADVILGTCLTYVERANWLGVAPESCLAQLAGQKPVFGVQSLFTHYFSIVAIASQFQNFIISKFRNCEIVKFSIKRF